MTDPVLSRDDDGWHQPPGSPRRYLLAPLTRMARNRFRRALVAEGATYPGNGALFAALRQAVRDIAPGNLDELLVMIDAAEDEQQGRDAGDAPGPATLALLPVEAAARQVPAFAQILADRAYYMAAYPGVLARFALRGWEGPGLPPFFLRNGEVPEDLLEAIPDAELTSLGWAAHPLAFVTRAAEKNFAAPSPSLGIPTPGTLN